MVFVNVIKFTNTNKVKNVILHPTTLSINYIAIESRAKDQSQFEFRKFLSKF